MTGNSSHNWTSSSTTRNDVKTYTIRHRYVNSPTQTSKLIAVICTWMYAGILIGCIEFFCHFITKRCPSIITSAMVRGGWLFSLLLCASVCQQHVSEMSTNSGEIFQGWGMWRSGLLRFFCDEWDRDADTAILKWILPLWDRGISTHFADNSVSCRQILRNFWGVKCLTATNHLTLVTNRIQEFLTEFLLSWDILPTVTFFGIRCLGGGLLSPSGSGLWYKSYTIHYIGLYSKGKGSLSPGWTFDISVWKRLTVAVLESKRPLIVIVVQLYSW